VSDGLEYDGEIGDQGDTSAPAPPPTDRTRVRRLPKRGRYDRASLDAVLDAGIIAHVGWTGEDGQPYATPTIAWRVGDRLYWHGSSASRMLRRTQGIPVCVTVTLLDGYVMARSGFNHSVNFRSAMVLGTAHLVTDPVEVEATLEAFIEGLYPGRWAQLRPMTPSERKATTVLWMDLTEASAKIRAEENHDDDGDETWPAWGGVIPLRVVADEPEPDPHVPVDIAPPAFRLPGVRREAAQGRQAGRER
jgi:nitroimidazol reductase NimA-like FMN-containing flavoprotein (pyridoxamine 5'-phosphate oxidase superfamily)